MTDRIRIDTDRVFVREVDGEVVILDLKSQTYLGGNQTAAALWPGLVEGASMEELSRSLCEKFGVEEEVAEADAEAFVSQLAQLDLLASD
jgi:Coenzyme PQQ synthesis protein D (PqqD)